MSPGATQRLDAFTDAAFAFAVTLMVVGGAGAPANYSALVDALSAVPAFAIGFALIGMFWWAHVRWRGFRGTGGGLSVFLTFLLVFVVLIFVHPLRAMSISFASFLTGSGGGLGRELGGVFLIYGVGFVAMSLVMLLLFRDARSNPELDQGQQRALRGEEVIWLILIGTGTISALLATSRATAWIAPMAYSTLPLTIGAFVWRFFGRRPAPERA